VVVVVSGGIGGPCGAIVVVVPLNTARQAYCWPSYVMIVGCSPPYAPDPDPDSDPCNAQSHWVVPSDQTYEWSSEGHVWSAWHCESCADAPGPTASAAAVATTSAAAATSVAGNP
jgi:hypothetical protein